MGGMKAVRLLEGCSPKQELPSEGMVPAPRQDGWPSQLLELPLLLLCLSPGSIAAL